jgi:hypothetical protein
MYTTTTRPTGMLYNCNVSHPTSLYGQKDISACELVASAAGFNIYTLTIALPSARLSSNAKPQGVCTPRVAPYILGVPSNVSDWNLYRRLVARMRVRLYQSEVRPSRVKPTTHLVDGPTPGSSKFASIIVTCPAPRRHMAKKTSVLANWSQARRDLIYILLQ